ncbi:MAG: hypothetical protein ACK44R_12095, partial [Burkholderiales bacterium]
MKNIRYSCLVIVLALGLAGISNPSFARVQSESVTKQAAKPKAKVKSKSKAKAKSKAKSKSISSRKKSSMRAKAILPKRQSFGEKAGLHSEADELSLRSSVA